MNSTEEAAIFEQYGWRFDAVQRVWIAPDEQRVSTDDLMLAAEVLGPGVERRVREIARQHGTVGR